MAWLQAVGAPSKHLRPVWVGALGTRAQASGLVLLANAPYGLFLDWDRYSSLWMIEAMSDLNWISPLALPSIAILFLMASILGWYVGSLIQWLRR
jgi:hypothetical protein